ncbi:hypothetical protein Patl1_18680 [Pistacia atlantica]|uniref:Uncharacterized protein n=1 Tax=Pistacia atlantica TaxID=434234 RepID=A0ACC1BXI0_9ROSI|nr:hypothetical protein Patl1_18680 [Pistacia atlantica]
MRKPSKAIASSSKTHLEEDYETTSASSEDEEEIERELAEVTFGDLQKARSDGSHLVYRKQSQEKKSGRANKNRPMEVSAKSPLVGLERLFKLPKKTKLGASLISLGGPKTLNTGNIKDLLVDGLSSSHSSGCKQKTENNLIQKLLQEIINNSRTAKRGSKLDKVHYKRSSSTVAGLPAAMDDYKVAFNDSQAALGNATNNTVGKFNSVTAAASDVDHYGIYGVVTELIVISIKFSVST